MNGKKIIDGLRDAVAGNFASVLIEGQKWVRDDDPDAFERGRVAGKHEAALETEYGSFSAHVQAVFREARALCAALEGDKLVDGLGAALNEHDHFIKSRRK
jgi:hypothetical protein